MIIDNNNESELSGLFYEFSYTRYCKRNEKTKNFPGFQGNNVERLISIFSVYCESRNDLDILIDSWNKQQPETWEYVSIGITYPKKLTVVQVRERETEMNGPGMKFLQYSEFPVTYIN